MIAYVVFCNNRLEAVVLEYPQKAIEVKERRRDAHYNAVLRGKIVHDRKDYDAMYAWYIKATRCI